MDVTLLYFEGCPNWKTLDRHLATLANELPDLNVTRRLVDTAELAQKMGFHGSPSILVDGSDPFAGPAAAAGLACRVYQTPVGPAGSPTLAQLRDVVAHG